MMALFPKISSMATAMKYSQMGTNIVESINPVVFMAEASITGLMALIMMATFRKAIVKGKANGNQLKKKVMYTSASTKRIKKVGGEGMNGIMDASTKEISLKT